MSIIDEIGPVFDGHNDVLLRLTEANDRDPRFDPVSAFLGGFPQGHVDRPRTRRGGWGAGQFAVFVPPVDVDLTAPPPPGPADEREPFPAIDPGHAALEAGRIAGLLPRIVRAASGDVRMARTVAQVRVAMDEGALAAVLHLEGAEAIDPDLSALPHWHAAGLRSLGLVWGRPNAFAHGVPFRYPSSPDIGPGLTDTGRALVRAANELGIVIDLSHLNAKGFEDVAAISTAPLVASHSAAHAICPAARNLLDRQLDAIAASGGVVGCNFYVGNVRPDGRNDADTPLSMLVDQVRHLVDRMGIQHVALGSDFDGAVMPAEIGDAGGVPRLLEALRDAGFDRDSLALIARENWLRVLAATWRESDLRAPGGRQA